MMVWVKSLAPIVTGVIDAFPPLVRKTTVASVLFLSTSGRSLAAVGRSSIGRPMIDWVGTLITSWLALASMSTSALRPAGVRRLFVSRTMRALYHLPCPPPPPPPPDWRGHVSVAAEA